MPKLSPTMEDGQVSRWLKKEGDKVSLGEPLAEIDTDKATMEMQALSAGVLRRILVKEGESAPLGRAIGIIGEADEDISALEAEIQGGEPAAQTEETEEKRPPRVEGKVALEETAKSRVARAVSGDGRSERIPEPSLEAGRVPVSPIAARMAAEAGINLKALRGSGPGGRIIKRDIEEAISAKEAAPAAAKLRLAAAPRPAEKPSVYGPSAFRDEPISQMRMAIAKRLVTSLGPVPHFFLTTEIEMDRAADMRRSLNEIDEELKISINDIVIKAAAAALMGHPQVNASFQDKIIRYYEHADIGVAVATKNGLITPVIRSADLKPLTEIAAETRELAARARARKLLPQEYTGASFSVSNLGMYGIDEFTGVINPPEGAILAIGAMTAKPVVRDNAVVVRQTMRVTMSCDHRVVDGATGAEFLKTFKKTMENPLYLFV
jgi:pyruvate dehydrogenase E2 component (dihydrolipoamide acetyltransferase)